MELYIAVNDLMPGFCKIGISEDSTNRISGLYGNWRIFRAWNLPNARYHETCIKRKLKDLAACGYELFNCPVLYLEAVAINNIENPVEIKLPEGVKTINLSVMEFGKLIRKVRKKQGLTQAELAGSCGTGPRFIGDLESGKPTIEMGKAIHVANMLGIRFYAQYGE